MRWCTWPSHPETLRCARSSTPTSSPPQPCSTPWSPTTCRAGLRQLQPRGRSHPQFGARRAATADTRLATRHVLRRRQGCRRGTAVALRRPARPRRVSCRIGSFRRPSDQTATWRPGSPTTTASAWSRPPSPSPAPGFAVLYGISPTPGLVGPSPGRALGYDPHDDAERWADLLRPARRTPRRTPWSAARTRSPRQVVPPSEGDPQPPVELVETPLAGPETTAGETVETPLAGPETTAGRACRDPPRRSGDHRR